MQVIGFMYCYAYHSEWVHYLDFAIVLNLEWVCLAILGTGRINYVLYIFFWIGSKLTRSSEKKLYKKERNLRTNLINKSFRI